MADAYEATRCPPNTGETYWLLKKDVDEDLPFGHLAKVLVNEEFRCCTVDRGTTVDKPLSELKGFIDSGSTSCTSCSSCYSGSAAA